MLTPLSYLLNKQLLKVTKQRNAEVITPPLLQSCVLFCSSLNTASIIPKEEMGKPYEKGRVMENKSEKNEAESVVVLEVFFIVF